MPKKIESLIDQNLQSIDYLINLVMLENLRQREKWGVQERTPFEWLAYLTEEVGELAKAISEKNYRDGCIANIIDEAIQVATLSLKIAEMYEL
jgi:NTP pyrophosphatase (non-canonical NTP hydrolase)